MTNPRIPARLRLAPTALLLLFAAAGPASAASVICFGDSLTAGVTSNPRDTYLYKLGIYLESVLGPSELRNRGRGGEDTEGGLPRLRSIVRSETADYVVILEGTNDPYRWADGLFDPRDTESHFTEMVREVQRSTSAVPILATVPPRVGDPADPENLDTRRVNDIIRRVASATGARLAEVYANVAPRASREIYTDNIHPSENGAGLIAEAIASAITGNSLSVIDLTPPLLIRRVPAAASTGNALNTTIEITLNEDKNAIDTASARMNVDGAPVTMEIVTSGGQVVFRYRFPTSLRFGQRVSVAFFATDTGVTPGPNEIFLSYSFTTVSGNGTNGDIDRSGRIDGADVAILAGSFGVGRGEARFRTLADIDGDGFVDGLDLMFLAARFGGAP